MRLAALPYAGVVVLLVGLLAGCGTSGGSGTEPSSRVTATPTPVTMAPGSPDSKAQQQAKADALGAYFGLMGDWQTALANPDSPVAGLSQHASDQALTLVNNDIQRSRRARTITKGKLLLSPEVTKLDLGTTPPVAQIDDCADTSNYRDYRASDGSPVDHGASAPGGLQHFLAHVREEGGVWRVYDLHFYNAGSCR